MRFNSVGVVLLAAAACTSNQMPRSAAPAYPTPPDAAGAPSRLAASPRHGEWVMIRTGPNDSLRSWVVYPERSTKAPVVIVVQEIFGLTPWIRSVADQLAADGFIAIAPDFLTMQNIPNGPDSVMSAASVAATRTLAPADVQRQIDAVARYGMSLPSAQQKYGIVGFCWGGGVSFTHATHSPTLGAAVVYYGPNPPPAALQTVRAPVLGLYGGEDNRVNSTIPAADSTLRALGRTYVPTIYAGAGHGFLRQQSGQAGANLTASQAAWPATIAWFRKHLGS